MEKKYNIAIDYINLILRFLTSYCFIIVLLNWLFNDITRLYMPLAWIVIPIYYCTLRKYIHALLPFFLLHCPVFLFSSFLCHNIEESIIFIIFCISEIIFSFISIQSNSQHLKFNTSLLKIAQIFGAYLFSIYLKLPIASNVIFIVAVSFCILYLINQYLIHFIDFYKTNKDFTNIPIQQIMSINHSLLSFFILLLPVVVYIFVKIKLSQVFLFIFKTIYHIISFIYSLLKSPKKQPDILPKLTPEPDTILPPYVPNEPSIIENIFFAAIQIVSVILIIAAIVYLIYQLYCAFHKIKKSDMDTKEYLFPFENKEPITGDHGNPRKNFSFPFIRKDNNEKIRYMFYKKILSTFPKNFHFPTNLTPEELIELAEENNVPWDELTKYYEKARYGYDLCNDNEVKAVKQLIHRKNK